MRPVELFRIALRALGANKLRSILTMLGIIIGVGAVITLVSVGEGVQKLVAEQIQSAGSNLLFVVPGEVGGGGRTGLTLTVADAESLADPFNVPDATAIAPELTQGAQVEQGAVNHFSTIAGVTPPHAFVRNNEISMGRLIDERDLTTRARVAVLGSKAYETFFPNGGYPIGETLQINRIPFRIVGVMKEKGGSALGSEDGNVWIPLSTAHSRLFNQRNNEGELLVSFIYVKVNHEDRMELAREDIERTLRERHKITFRDDDDFSVISQTDLLSIFGEITSVLTLFLGAIAGISLLVGGIGIMNIMLVSVTERTREIGIRKAIGAKRRDILSQFLIEAILLSISGGFLGILLGWGGAVLVSNLQDDLTAVVSPFAILLATSVSVAVGLFFGLYPALRASRLNPIDALRYE
ncbi:MAG: ABC transporter permease [Chloroflexota bacterium]|nr:ABC transporter permease [Chloroflexota bacterium]